jgi:hypothetical protein
MPTRPSVDAFISLAGHAATIHQAAATARDDVSLCFVRAGMARRRGVRPGQGTVQRRSSRRQPWRPPLLLPTLGRLGVRAIDLATCRCPPPFFCPWVDSALWFASNVCCFLDCIIYLTFTNLFLSNWFSAEDMAGHRTCEKITDRCSYLQHVR